MLCKLLTILGKLPINTFAVLTALCQLTMECLTSVAVGGLAGLSTRGTGTLPTAVAIGSFEAVLVEVVAESAVATESMQMMSGNCIMGQGE